MEDNWFFKEPIVMPTENFGAYQVNEDGTVTVYPHNGQGVNPVDKRADSNNLNPEEKP